MSAVTDRYAIDLLRREGHVLRLMKEAEAVPVTASERDAAKQRVTAAMRRLGPSAADGPAGGGQRQAAFPIDALCRLRLRYNE